MNIAPGEIDMENEQVNPQSYEEREAQTLVDRIEQKEVSTAREAEMKRTLDDYGKTAGS
jgi:hypothetical protein